MGYAGWVNEPLNDAEDEILKTLKTALPRALTLLGYPQDVVKGLNIDITRASLTISAEEARTGAFHNLADGEPFYRLSIHADNTSIESEPKDLVYTVMNFINIFNPCSMSLGMPLAVTHDFRDPTMHMIFTSVIIGLCMHGEEQGYYTDKPSFEKFSQVMNTLRQEGLLPSEAQAYQAQRAHHPQTGAKPPRP